MMKKILYIFILFPLFAISQNDQDWNYVPIIADNNMSVVFAHGILSDFAGDEIKAYAVKYEYGGPADHLLGIPPIDSTIVPVSPNWMIIEDESNGFPIMGTDNLCGCIINF